MQVRAEIPKALRNVVNEGRTESNLRQRILQFGAKAILNENIIVAELDFRHVCVCVCALAASASLPATCSCEALAQ